MFGWYSPGIYLEGLRKIVDTSGMMASHMTRKYLKTYINWCLSDSDKLACHHHILTSQ
jgi:hypothetical protein